MYIEKKIIKQSFVNLSNIINNKNKLINKNFIDSILHKYDIKYSISNLLLFQQAMTHITYTDKYLLGNIDPTMSPQLTFSNSNNIDFLSINNDINTNTTVNPDFVVPLQKNSYDRLEFLGDSIIHFIITEYLFHRYEQEHEGFMTKLRIKIENGVSLAKLSKILCLNEFVLIAKSIELLNARNNTKILEDIFESFIGALYIDAGFDVCKQFIISLIEKEIDIPELLYTDVNYKDLLSQYHFKHKIPTPTYECIETINTNPNNIFFRMCVKDSNNNILGIGKGKTKKKASQIAAQNALIKYGEIKNLNYDKNNDYDYDYNYNNELSTIISSCDNLDDTIIYENSDCE